MGKFINLHDWVDGWVNWVSPPKSVVQKIKIELKIGLKIKCKYQSMIRSYKLNRNYTNANISTNMDILKPTPMVRQIGENKWDAAKAMLKDSHEDMQLVSSHYSYKVDSSTWVPQIMERATIHVLERLFGPERYLRHTITISGKKWRQNELENEEDLGRWIMQHPSAVQGIHTEEESIEPRPLSNL